MNKNKMKNNCNLDLDIKYNYLFDLIKDDYIGVPDEELSILKEYIKEVEYILFKEKMTKILFNSLLY